MSFRQVRRSKELLERAEEEHARCIKRWDEIRKKHPMFMITVHTVEAHLPGPVHDLRGKNA